MATPKSWNARAVWRTSGNKTVNGGLWYILTVAVLMLSDPYFGGEKDGAIKCYQGSWSDGAKSAGTHTGPSAGDFSPYNDKNRVLVFRLLGCAAWLRVKTRYWIRHIHLIVCGDSGVHWLAALQVKSFWAKGTGLASGGRDNGPNMYGARPLFIFPLKDTGKPGKLECVTACHAYTRQTTKAPQHPQGAEVEVGDVLDIVAFTRDQQTRKVWGLTKNGRCVYADNFKRVA